MYHMSLLEYDGGVNMMKGAIETADKVTTVSPSYAWEILDPWYSHGMDRILRTKQYKLSGILNGIDVNGYDPETDEIIEKNYYAIRTVGKKAAAFTLVCDVLKGVMAIVVAILAGRIWTEVDETLLEYIAGFFAILGHTFPIFFEFRGGKGVATALGVLITLNWKIGLICLIFAVIIIAFTKMVSVGSILAAVLYPILTIFMGDVKFLPVMISILIALLVIFNHRENLKRIKNGTENKISFKK